MASRLSVRYPIPNTTKKWNWSVSDTPLAIPAMKMKSKMKMGVLFIKQMSLRGATRSLLAKGGDVAIP